MAPAAERLEGRAVLAVAIAQPAAAVAVTASTYTIGGTADAGSLVQIYNDANYNGALDAGDPVVGSEQLAAGATDFAIAVPLASVTANNFLAVATPPGQGASAPVAVPTITNRAPVSGTVFLNRGGNGFMAPGAPGIPGRAVYLDLDESGTFDNDEPIAVTDARGQFTFPDHAADSARARVQATGVAAYRYAVNQNSFTYPNTVFIGVTPYSPVAPVPIVPNPELARQTSDANSNYVQSLYETVLGREPGAGEVGGWLNEMAGGMSTGEVAARFVNSPEHRTSQVASYYRNFLRRDVDPLAQVWVDDLISGALTDQQVARGILNSAEYLRLADSDLETYVRNLYSDVLGRTAGDPEVASQLGQIPQDQFSASYADRVVGSAEVADQIVDGFYANFLRRDRQPDTTSAFWVDRLTQGASASAVEVGILSSPEFFAYAQRRTGPVFTTS